VTVLAAAAWFGAQVATISGATAAWFLGDRHLASLLTSVSLFCAYMSERAKRKALEEGVK
jgi:hypothetical protein